MNNTLIENIFITLNNEEIKLAESGQQLYFSTAPHGVKYGWGPITIIDQAFSGVTTSNGLKVDPELIAKLVELVLIPEITSNMKRSVEVYNGQLAETPMGYNSRYPDINRQVNPI